ncbi:MAG TPA: hypothetical protein VH331_01130 [Allosphingosinicella sp.]|jgi:hypothetical protein|nr:hypothetical protein [Allosphingosinicella sp.]
MSSSRAEFLCARRLIGLLALGMVLLLGLMPASASGERSSPEDRQRFVSITRELEQAPLKPALKADRAWALEWLTNAPDVTANVCADKLGGLLQSKYPYAGEIVLQDTFSMAALQIEHPETAHDPNAQQLAGMEGALNAYRSILRDKPEAKSPALESLLQTQARGELPDYVGKAWIRCSAKSGEKLPTMR